MCSLLIRTLGPFKFLLSKNANINSSVSTTIKSLKMTFLLYCVVVGSATMSTSANRPAFHILQPARNLLVETNVHYQGHIPLSMSTKKLYPEGGSHQSFVSLPISVSSSSLAYTIEVFLSTYSRVSSNDLVKL